MSLIVPDQYKSFTILGIDPGLNNTGVAVFQIDAYSRMIQSIVAFTINTNRLVDTTGIDDELHTDRIIKLYKLKQSIQTTIAQVNPVVIACESAFYNPKFPMAYPALVEAIDFIQSAAIEVNGNIVFRTIEPKVIKKIVGAGMDKGKLDVKAAVANTPSLMQALQMNLELLDQHSIDAIAIGYTFLKLSEG